MKLHVFAASALFLAAGGVFAQDITHAPPLNAATPATQAHAGFIKSVQGTVRVKGPSGALRAAKSGDTVAAADQIQTDASAGASVVLRDGTMIVVGPSSQVDLKQFSFDATTQEGGLFLSLVRGSMRMVTGILGKKPESVRVDTQTATIGIRGTDFIVTADDKI